MTKSQILALVLGLLFLCLLMGLGGVFIIGYFAHDDLVHHPVESQPQPTLTWRPPKASVDPALIPPTAAKIPLASVPWQTPDEPHSRPVTAESTP